MALTRRMALGAAMVAGLGMGLVAPDSLAQEHRDRFNASINELFEADSVEVEVEIQKIGPTTPETLTMLRTARERMVDVLKEAGHADIVVTEKGLNVRQSRRARNNAGERFTGRLNLALRFPKRVDLLEVLGNPDLTDIAEIKRTTYWIADPEGLRASLEARLAANVETEIAERHAGKNVRVTGRSFRSSLDGRGMSRGNKDARIPLTASLDVTVLWSDKE